MLRSYLCDHRFEDFLGLLVEPFPVNMVDQLRIALLEVLPRLNFGFQEIVFFESATVDTRKVSLPCCLRLVTCDSARSQILAACAIVTQSVRLFVSSLPVTMFVPVKNA